MTITKDRLIRKLDEDVVRLTAFIKDWSVKFRANPFYQLSWGTETFEHAAELQLARGTLAFLTGEINPDFAGDRVAVLVEEYTRDVLRDASHAERSTSPCANLMGECKRMAKAKLLAYIMR